MIGYLLETFRRNADQTALVWHDREFSYQWLLDRVDLWRERIGAESIPGGAVVALEADFSPNAVALFLALTGHRCILAPITSSVAALRDEFLDVAEVELTFAIGGDDEVAITRFERSAAASLFQELRRRGHPGLVLFSSGSSGKSKAAVHDLTPILEHHQRPKRTLRTISFLLYDHIGGVNTMLYVLANGGCMVTVPERTPEAVLAAVERHKVELLPVSPTFLNLVLLSEAYRNVDLSSLETVSYGTEPMPESTLRRFSELFPKIRMVQLYGLSEAGILQSTTKSSDALWIRLSGEGLQTRIVDGILQLKTRSAMLGYLNAPSPFTGDGWLNTGDAVEVDGDYIRILGRQSELINVGGEKVYPAEVEGVIQGMPNVLDVSVYREANPITGQIVCASVTLAQPEPLAAFKKRMRAFCRERLQSFKIPVRVKIIEGFHHSGRFKKIRREN